MDPLTSLQNIPIDNTLIGNLFPEISGKNQKVRELEKAGKIVRLKRGLYVVNPEVNGVPVSTELIANHLYGPSYVSMLSALRYYGLIPETVYIVQSMTIKHSRSFENTFGQFQYFSCNRDYFSVGLSQETNGKHSFVIASPEKALCDLIVNTTGLNFRYKKEVLECLEFDFRFDMEAFSHLRPEVFRQCASAGKKNKSLLLLAKILEQ